MHVSQHHAEVSDLGEQEPSIVGRSKESSTLQTSCRNPLQAAAFHAPKSLQYHRRFRPAQLKHGSIGGRPSTLSTPAGSVSRRMEPLAGGRTPDDDVRAIDILAVQWPTCPLTYVGRHRELDNTCSNYATQYNTGGLDLTAMSDTLDHTATSETTGLQGPLKDYKEEYWLCATQQLMTRHIEQTLREQIRTLQRDSCTMYETIQNYKAKEAEFAAKAGKFKTFVDGLSNDINTLRNEANTNNLRNEQLAREVTINRTTQDALLEQMTASVEKAIQSQDEALEACREATGKLRVAVLHSTHLEQENEMLQSRIAELQSKITPTEDLEVHRHAINAELQKTALSLKVTQAELSDKTRDLLNLDAKIALLQEEITVLQCSVEATTTTACRITSWEMELQQKVKEAVNEARKEWARDTERLHNEESAQRDNQLTGLEHSLRKAKTEIGALQQKLEAARKESEEARRDSEEKLKSDHEFQTQLQNSWKAQQEEHAKQVAEMKTHISEVEAERDEAERDEAERDEAKGIASALRRELASSRDNGKRLVEKSNGTSGQDMLTVVSDGLTASSELSPEVSKASSKSIHGSSSQPTDSESGSTGLDPLKRPVPLPNSGSKIVRANSEVSTHSRGSEYQASGRRNCELSSSRSQMPEPRSGSVVGLGTVPESSSPGSVSCTRPDGPSKAYHNKRSRAQKSWNAATYERNGASTKRKGAGQIDLDFEPERKRRQHQAGAGVVLQSSSRASSQHRTSQTISRFGQAAARPSQPQTSAGTGSLPRRSSQRLNDKYKQRFSQELNTR